LRVSYHPDYYAFIGDNHPFPIAKFRGLHAHLTASGIVPEHRIIAPQPVSAMHLNLVHTQRYTQAIRDGTLDAKEVRRLGMPWSPALARRSVLATQGTLNAALMALEDGIAGNLAGGTHHAFPDHGEGFCVFNDVAVTIRALKQAMWIKKALIVDCDVHQGNGTAFIFRDDPDVFTFSIHGEHNFPFRKQPSSLDVGLPDNTNDREYLLALEAALKTIGTQFQPDIVFYLGGIDVLATDRFGRLSLTMNGLRERDRLVIRHFHRLDLPLVLTLSGGYAPTLQETVAAHSVMFEEAVTLRTEV
jgi:acetoin utilization deacetylase AcuC-like enzyme